MIAKTLTKLRQDESGAAAALFALAAPPLIGCCAVGLDLASLYLAERDLQGIADAAALSAVAGDVANDAEANALAAIAADGAANVKIHGLALGRYARNAEVDFDARFAESDADPNAVRLTLTREVPLFFASFLTGGSTSHVVASASSAKADLVAFELGSNIFNLSGGLPGQILSQLTGAELNLSEDDILDLAAGSIDIIEFAAALRVQQGDVEATFGEALATDTELEMVLNAMADVVDNAGAATALREIAASADFVEIRMADMIDLGALAHADVNDGQTDVAVSAFSLARSALELSFADGYALELDFEAPGVSSATLHVAGGGDSVRSPWLSIDSSREIVLRTSEARVYLDMQVDPRGIGATLLHVPLYLELAPAEARIDEIYCGNTADSSGAVLDVLPSLGTFALAQADMEDFEDLTTPVDLQPATILRTPVAKVDGFSEVMLGGVESQLVDFSLAEIRQGVRKQVQSDDIVAATLSTLVENGEFEVNALGATLAPLGSNLVRTVPAYLLEVAPGVDNVVNHVTSLLGLKLGVAEVKVDRLSCGAATLVA